MLSKNRISQIRKLHAKKFRDESGLFLVEGYKCVEMLCASDFGVEEIFATESALRDNRWLQRREVTIASAEEMARISTMQTSPELLAIARQRTGLPGIPADRPVLVLDHISDPGNLGTIIRTADWFDIRHIVCSPDCVEFYNPKTIQATMGSFAHVSVHRLPLVPFLQREGTRRRILGTFLNGHAPHHHPFACARPRHRRVAQRRHRRRRGDVALETVTNTFSQTHTLIKNASPLWFLHKALVFVNLFSEQRTM